MANKGGVITRRDIIEEDALNWGSEYSKLMRQAIDSNKEFASGVLKIADAMKSMRGAENNSAFLKAKEEERLATLKNINTIREQEVAEISLEKIKRAKLATDKAALDAENRKQAAQKRGQAQTAVEIVNQSILARNAKNHALANSKLATEYEKLTAKTRLAATALQNILIRGREVGESTAAYSARLQRAQREFDNLHARVVIANRAIQRFNDNVGNYPKEAAAAIRDLVQAFGIVGGITTFVAVFKDALTIVIEFESEMVNLAAIAGKTREEISPLEHTIRDVAKASINSATDVAKLAAELIKLGSTPEEVENLLAPINNLSIALKASAEDSATLVKSLLNSYGEGAEEAGRFTDVLAESANRSALDFEGLRDSFSYLAPTSRTLGISIERTAAILGVLADNGIKAESAGRLTSTAFARLAKQGLTYEDALKKINDAQKDGKTELEVLALATELFGAEAGKIGIILANNTAKINESTIAYQNSNGALEELTNKQLKSVSAELEILSSSWEEYILNTDEATGGTIAMTSTLRFLSANLDTIINLALVAGTAWAAYKAAIFLANLQTKLMALNLTAATTAQAQNITVTGFGTAAQVANAQATTVATTAWQRFNAAMKANALGLVIAALIFLVATLNSYGQSLEESTSETKKSTDAFLKNKDQVAKNGVSIKTLSDRYDELSSKTNRSAEEQKELNKIIAVLGKTVPGAVIEVNKYGEAIGINTVKTREFIEAQRDLYKLENSKKLKENIALLKKLQDEQRLLTISESDLNSKHVEGIGNVRKRNGVLESYNKILSTSRPLNEEELIIFKKKVIANEQNIGIVKRNIDILSGLSKAEKDASDASTASANAKQQAAVRTIAVIDAEIQAQEDLIDSLSDKTGKAGDAIKARIAALKAERELIYSTEKADKKAGKDRLKNIKDVMDAIYDLSQFRYQNEIDINKRIVDDEKQSIDERLDALYSLEQARTAKNEETLRYELERNALEKDGLNELSSYKLNLYIKDSEARIEAILSGKIATANMTAEELLIWEKFYANKKVLQDQDAKDKQAIIDSEVALIQKQADSDKATSDRKLNEAIEAENQLFLATSNLENKNMADREAAILEHERRIYEIKKRAALDALQIQIQSLESELAANDAKDEKERISTDLRKKLGEDLQAAKTEYSNIETENYIGNIDEKTRKEIEFAEAVLDISQNLTNALGDLANAIFDTKIQNLDEELRRSDEYYAHQIEMAGDDAAQRELLEQEAEKKRKKIEDKKRKEQVKQAIMNKALAVVEIGFATAQGIMQSYAQLGPIAGNAGALLVGILGAIQTAAVLAAPIPKYKDGRLDGPAELAEVGDGYRREVISGQDGSNPKITPAKPTLTFLKKGDMVHKSIEDYNRYIRASILASVDIENNKLGAFQAGQSFGHYDAELLNEMKLTRKAIEKNKPLPPPPAQNLDINHHLWAMSNKKWN